MSDEYRVYGRTLAQIGHALAVHDMQMPGCRACDLDAARATQPKCWPSRLRNPRAAPTPSRLRNPRTRRMSDGNEPLAGAWKRAAKRWRQIARRSTERTIAIEKAVRDAGLNVSLAVGAARPVPAAEPRPIYGPCGCGCHNDERYHPKAVPAAEPPDPTDQRWQRAAEMLAEGSRNAGG